MATLITNNGIQRMDDNALEHFGILGMKWGIRRYQPYGEGGYNPKKKGKYVGKLNPQQKREYKLSKQENRERAARATVISGVAAGALTAAGVFSPYSIPVSMISTAAINTGINIVKNHRYKTFLKEQNEIHNEQINIGRDYVRNVSQSQENLDRKAQTAAKKDGLDQGDNWKVYRDAMQGDTKAAEVVNAWQKKKTVNDKATKYAKASGMVDEKMPSGIAKQAIMDKLEINRREAENYANRLDIDAALKKSKYDGSELYKEYLKNPDKVLEREQKKRRG